MTNNVDYISIAINRLAVAQDAILTYICRGFIVTEEDFNNNIEVEGDKSFNFTWSDVQAKATELETIDTQKVTDKVNAKAKLIAGETLTEAEADTIVL